MNKKVKKALYLTGEVALHVCGFTSGFISSMAESTAKSAKSMNNPAEEAFEALSDTTRNISDTFHEYAHSLNDKRHHLDDDRFASIFLSQNYNNECEEQPEDQSNNTNYDEYE